MTYIFDKDRGNRTDDWWDVFDQGLVDAIDEFSENSKLISVTSFSVLLLRNAFVSDITNDLFLIMASVGLVCVYAVIMLGSCSPI